MYSTIAVMELYFIIGVVLLGVNTLVQGMPQYEVQVAQDVHFDFAFENQLSNGTCCSSAEQPPCATPCDEIELHIILCFLEDTTIIAGPEVPCPLGSVTFASDAGNDTVTLNATLEATSTTYPGSYQLLFTVETANATEIGIRHAVYMHPVQDWMSTNFNSETHTIDAGTLSIPRIRVVCIEGYFGPDCGCSPRNDSTGHFTCATDGTIVCLPGYQNPETNCTEEEVVTQEPTTMETTEDTVTTEPSTTVDTSAISTEPWTTMDSTTEENPSDQTTTGNSTTVPQTIVPIAIGGAVGGLLFVLVLIGILVVIVMVYVYKRRRSWTPGKEDDRVIFTAVTVSRRDSEDNPSQTSDISTEVVAMYAKIKKNQDEEAPPIIPYNEVDNDEQVHMVDNGVPDPGYTEVSTENRPQTNEIVYADLDVSKPKPKPKPKVAPKPQRKKSYYDNINTAEVQYAKIQRGES